MKNLTKQIRSMGSGTVASLACRLVKLLAPGPFPSNASEWRYLNCSYSQFGEDIIINKALDHLKRFEKAYYVDVGCYHPFQYSNTLLLHWKGWSGVNIDPIQSTIYSFSKERPSDTSLCLALSDKQGESEFLKYPIQATGRLAEAAGSKELSVLGENVEERMKVKTETLGTVLETHAPISLPFGVLSVDCEGSDLSVLKGNNWSKFRPWILAVEDEDKSTDSSIHRYILDKDYELFSIAHLTKIYLDKK